ncbi:MAG TPA: succinate dehydrogenase [Candidatus Eisenbacteria bacterium]|nr:succinate dehydrogenase [Candidatus Eisenbacteria bacterium]
MSPETQRRLSSGVGAASAPGLPATGTKAGAWRGAGLAQPFGATERTDNWWFIPVIQALGLVALIGYANYAAILGAQHYHYVENGRDYLSPFYSPYIHPSWLPAWLSPALLILIFPLGFRTTCYYYRKAYYRSFFADPIACAVGEPRKGYCGELKFPFILQNLHRYFLYAALVFLVILWIDVIKAFIFFEPVTTSVSYTHVRQEGGHYLGIAGGSLAILASTLTLTLYTFSCHSLRHLIGGRLDCFSCAVAGGPRQKAWGWVSILNEHHMGWAWASLFAVCFADFYVRMCSMGAIQDPMFVTFRELFRQLHFQP